MNQGINTGQLPENIQFWMAEAETGRVDYPEREAQLLRIESYLQNGNYFMAESQLKDVIERQSNLRKGPTAVLQALLISAETGRVDNPEHEVLLSRIRGHLQNGSYFTAESMLKDVAEQQSNLRNDLPAELQALLSAADAARVDYPEREAQLLRIGRYLQNGNYFVAESQLKDVIERQSNLRKGPTAVLQALLSSAETGRVDNPEHEVLLSRIRGHLQNGNYFTAESMLKDVAEQQNNLRNGPSAKLQALLSAVDADRVDYPEREEQLLRIGRYLQNGNYFVAESLLKNVTEQQKNLSKKRS